MKRRILVRHGQSIGNIDPHNYELMPDYAITLTPKGIMQARDAGAQLNKIEGTFGIYYSPYFRARRTTEAILSLLDPGRVKFVRRDDRLREQESPLKITMTDEKTRYHNGKYFETYPRGESYCDVYDRLAGQRETAIREAGYLSVDNVVCIGHGTEMLVDVGACLNLTTEDVQLIHTPENCAIIVLDFQPDGSYKLDESYTKLTRRSHDVCLYQYSPKISE